MHINDSPMNGEAQSRLKLDCVHNVTDFEYSLSVSGSILQNMTIPNSSSGAKVADEASKKLPPATLSDNAGPQTTVSNDCALSSVCKVLIYVPFPRSNCDLPMAKYFSHPSGRQ